MSGSTRGGRNGDPSPSPSFAEGARANSILASLAEIIVTLDGEGRITSINHPEPGIDENDLLGSRWLDSLDEGTRPRAEEALRATLETGDPQEIEFVAAGPARQQAWYHVRMVPLASSSPDRVVLVASDITPRRKTERDLRDAVQRMRQAERTARVGHWRHDVRTGEFEPSEELMRIVGAPPGAAAANAEEYVHPDDRAQRRRYFEQVLAGKPYTGHEWRAIRPDGAVRYLSGSAEPVFDDAGNVVAVFGVTQDVTERTEALLAARESAEQYRALFENMLEGFAYCRMIYDDQGRPDDFIYLSVNPAFSRLTGLQDAVGKGVTELVPTIKEMNPELLEIYDRVATTGAPAEFDIDFHPIDKWLHVSASRPREGEFVAFFSDVTERMAAQDALRTSKARLDAALASMTDGVYISDADGDLVDFNEAYAKINRFAGKEECLRTYKDNPDLFEVYLSTGELAPLDQWAVPRALRGEVVVDAEYTVRRKDTGAQWIGSYSFGPIRDDAGEIVGSVVVSRDISDRKRAERDLHESEERHRELFENMAQGVVYQLADGTILAANPAAERILGVTADQLQGRTSVDPRWRAVRADGSDFPGEEHPAAVALRTGQPVHDVVMGVFHPGEEAHRWISIDAVPEFHPGEDEPYRVFATFDDITERKRMEEDLRRSEAEARETVERLSRAQRVGRMGDWEWDVATGEVRWSEEVYRIYGVDRGFTTTLDTIVPMVHADDRDRDLAEAQAIVDDPDRSSGALRFRIVRPDGSVRHIFQTLAVDRERDGRAARVFGIMQDVTELREAEHALVESERRFRRFYDAGLVGVAFWTVTGGITDANDRFLTMLGYTRQDLEAGAIDWVAMTPPEFRERDEQSLAELRETGRNRRPFEKAYYRKDGSMLPVLVTGAMLHDDGMAGIVIVLDISDQKRAEEELRSLNLELEEHVRRRTADLEAANAELESFSYSVSHDLRAPLRHIAGFAELLREHVVATDAQSEHFAEVITRAAVDMGVLIDDLLQFSRVGRAEMRVESVDMGQLVHETLEVAQSDLGERRVEVAVGEIPSAAGDRTLLRQVWANLIGNAFKYTRPRDPAVIEIGSHQESGEQVYWVRDNGVGFDMQYAGRLFHVFERLHRSDEFEGTGIGLANVNRIVVRHGGRCWAEAAEDKGATLFFSLPVGTEQ